MTTFAQLGLSWLLPERSEFQCSHPLQFLAPLIRHTRHSAIPTRRQSRSSAGSGSHHRHQEGCCSRARIATAHRPGGSDLRPPPRQRQSATFVCSSLFPFADNRAERNPATRHRRGFTAWFHGLGSGAHTGIERTLGSRQILRSAQSRAATAGAHLTARDHNRCQMQASPPRHQRAASSAATRSPAFRRNGLAFVPGCRTNRANTVRPPTSNRSTAAFRGRITCGRVPSWTYRA